MEAGDYARLAQTRGASGGPPGVLVVHFDDAIRLLVSETLELEGYDEVVCAADGVEALARIHDSTRPLIVVLSRLLPIIDGESILRAIECEPLLLRYHGFLLLGEAWEWHMQPRRLSALPHAPWPMLKMPFDVLKLIMAMEGARAELIARVERPRARGQLF